MLLSGLIIFSFKNPYVSAVAILSYSYLTIIQLVPLYKQMSNNIWHSILPVDESIKKRLALRLNRQRQTSFVSLY